MKNHIVIVSIHACVGSYSKTKKPYGAHVSVSEIVMNFNMLLTKKKQMYGVHYLRLGVYIFVWHLLL